MTNQPANQGTGSPVIDRRVAAVHRALAESAGIYDLTDDEAAHFLRVFDASTQPVCEDGDA